MGSPPMAQTPTGATDMSRNMHPPSGTQGPNDFVSGRPSLPPVVTAQQQRAAAQQHAMLSPSQGPPTANHYHPPQVAPSYNTNVPSSGQMYNAANPQAPVLPPFSSLPSGAAQGNNRHNVQHRESVMSSTSGSKRTAPSSNVTSTHSSDIDDEHDGELPASGLVAPWEVLRNLANVAIQREARVCCPATSLRVTDLHFRNRRTVIVASPIAERGPLHLTGRHDPQNVERFDTKYVAEYTRMVSSSASVANARHI